MQSIAEGAPGGLHDKLGSVGFGPGPCQTSGIRPMQNPPDHEAALRGVLDAVRLMGENPLATEDQIVEWLRQLGHSEVEAERLNVFVPSAFSWVVLQRMGVSAFPSHFIALARDDQEVQLPLAREHCFTAALTLAYGVMENGWTADLSRETFETVISRSAEMAAANMALQENDSLEGASINPLRILRLSAEDVARPV